MFLDHKNHPWEYDKSWKIHWHINSVHNFRGFPNSIKFSVKVQSVSQLSCSVVSDSLRPHGLQHARLPSPSPTPQSLLKLMSIESVMPFNHLILCRPLLLPPSIFPSIRVFSSEHLFESGGQNIGVSASTSVLPMNIQDWLPLGLTGWISLQSKRLSPGMWSQVGLRKHHYKQS